MAEHPLRVMIVDDESPARALLQMICADHDVCVVGEAASGEAALELSGRLRPDLVLLDISMPGMGGLTAARRIAHLQCPPAVVFTTAFDGHALAAFDVGAVDYLLKPIVEERFSVMLERVRMARANGRGSPVEDHVWVPVRSELKRVPLNAIERVTAERDYVKLHVEQRSFLLRATMDDMAGKLDPTTFLRIHRSTIIRRDQVSGLQHEGSGVWSLMLVNGETARIGRSYLATTKVVLARPDRLRC